MKKIALFAFKGDFTCFVHVMLNALDMKAKVFDVKVVLEGESTKLVPELAKDGSPMFGLYNEMKQQGLIDAVCKACSAKMNVVEAVEKEGLPLVDEMKGHPSMAKYMEAGYEIITF
jgi:hypothetical protein